MGPINHDAQPAKPLLKQTFGLGLWIDEWRRSATALQQFQRPAPQHQRLGLIGPLRCLVDDPNRHAVKRQLTSHRHSHRAGPHD